MTEADELAFRAYAVSHRPALRRTAFLSCGDWHQADDLVQRALTKLFVSWKRTSRSDPDAFARRLLTRHPTGPSVGEAAAFPDEPNAPFDMDRIVAAGRRSLRGRAALTAGGVVAVVVAVTAAIVVPIRTSGSDSADKATPQIAGSAGSSATPTPNCDLYVTKGTSGTAKAQVSRVLRQHHLKRSQLSSTNSYRKVGGTVVEICRKPGQ